MVVTRFALFSGSNANEGDEPSLEFWMVIWYLSGNVGFKSKDPKSMNSSCQIVLILAKTRASTGKFTDVNTTVGRSPYSPAKDDCKEQMPSGTMGTSSASLSCLG